jgi:hypothetical protein
VPRPFYRDSTEHEGDKEQRHPVFDEPNRHASADGWTWGRWRGGGLSRRLGGISGKRHRWADSVASRRPGGPTWGGRWGGGEATRGEPGIAGRHGDAGGCGTLDRAVGGRMLGQHGNSRHHRCPRVILVALPGRGGANLPLPPRHPRRHIPDRVDSAARAFTAASPAHQGRRCRGAWGGAGDRGGNPFEHRHLRTPLGRRNALTPVGSGSYKPHRF